MYGIGNRALLVAGVLLLVQLGPAIAKTSNGNDFALFFSEAGTARERQALLDDARGRPHFFRYLQIVQVEEGEKDGRPYVAMVTREPGSFMKVRFVVTKRESLRKLREAPESKVGDAIAVTGRLVSVGESTGVIALDPVIVKRKDRLEPKMGKELLHEVDPSAVFYSYTGGKKAVHLTYRDRDLLRAKDEILGKQGKQAWADFLAGEVAKREKRRAAEGGD